MCDLITFTGSVKVGKHIAAIGGYRRLVLELGGNDPLIVMEDADLDKAADLAVTGATKNSGQRCTAVKRILVRRKRRRPLRREGPAVARRRSNAAIRSDPETDVGTVINERSAKLFEARVADAVAHGAQRLYGARAARRAVSARSSSTTSRSIASWCARRRSVR